MPGMDLPPPDEPVDDVGIGLREVLGDGPVLAPEHEKRATDRIAKRTGHLQLTPRIRLLHQLKVLWPIRHPSIGEVVDNVVDQRKVHEIEPRAPIQSGMFPCFFGGFLSLLFSRLLSAAINLRRVVCGRITSSTNPRELAMYGLANLSRN